MLFDLLGESLERHSAFNSEVLEIRDSRKGNVGETVFILFVAQDNDDLARHALALCLPLGPSVGKTQWNHVTRLLLQQLPLPVRLVSLLLPLLFNCSQSHQKTLFSTSLSLFKINTVVVFM